MALSTMRQKVGAMTICEQHFRSNLAPPSNLPMWQWWEANIELDNTSAAPGKKFSTKFAPMLRWYSDAKQNPRTRRITLMVSAQSMKTQTALNSLLHDIAEDPGPAMWVSASKESCEETAQKRIFPAIENCALTASLLPKDRNRRSKRLIQLDSMNLMLRGANSRIGLQSDPVRRIYCDERREWKRGSIDMLRKRTRTFHNAIEISMGTAGVKDDELHTDYLEGNQIIPHFHCPKCNHSQPLRFGRKASVLFPSDRDHGGLVVDENETTRPFGTWDYDAVRKAVRIECEKCEERFSNVEKRKLIKTLHPVAYNPKAREGYVSFHWNALLMLWESCDIGEIYVEFLKATAAYRLGNIEPLKAFVTETLGEPWEERGDRPKDHELLRQCGGKIHMPYSRGTLWLEPVEIASILTADVQAAQGGFIKWVARQWKENADSRLLDYGMCRSYDDLRDIQHQFGINDGCVFIDSGWGPGTSDTYKACVEYSWQPMKGDAGDYFTVYVDKSPRRIAWKMTDVDPSLGKQGQGRATLPLILWKHNTYRDRLLLHICKGRGPLWLLPDDIGEDWLKEMTSNERRTEKKSNGSMSSEWIKRAGVPDDWLDCELEQLVAADAGGVTVVGEAGERKE